MIRPQFVDVSFAQPPVEQVGWLAYLLFAAQWDGLARISIRSSYGVGYTDVHYTQYRKAISDTAAANKIPLAIRHYHYAYPQYNLPEAEAAWQKSVVGDIGPLDDIMLDWEENVTAATPDWAYRWLIFQQKVYGRLPTIYLSSSFAAGYVHNPKVAAFERMLANTYTTPHANDPRLAAFPLTLANWQFDPNETPPAPHPWTAYSYLQYTDKATVPGFGNSPVDCNVALTGVGGTRASTNVVAQTLPSYQWEAGESWDKCGPWAVSELKYAGQIHPTGTFQQVDDWAEKEYVAYVGPDVPGNTTGSSIGNMHSYLKDASLPYQDITGINTSSAQSSDISNIQSALDYGYPVLALVTMNSVFRRDGSQPYNVGNALHIFTLVGYTNDGFWLVADSYNNVDVWPVAYSQARLNTQWATVVQLPWLPTIQAGDPATWTQGKHVMNTIPSGWNDTLVDGDPRLTNPVNSFFVRGAFRQVVLSWPGGWESWNVPEQNEEVNPVAVEQSNAPLGPGVSQTFADRRLEMLAKQGNKIIPGFLGQELMWWKYIEVPALQAAIKAYQENLSADASVITDLTATTQAQKQTILAQQAAVDDLTAKLAACVAGESAAIQSAIDQGEAGLQTIIKTAQDAVTVLQPYASKTGSPEGGK